jgi:hypothetical protein
MKVKMLRSLGRNLADVHPDFQGVDAGLPPDQPLTTVLETQVREMPYEFSRLLVQHGLAEETGEDLTELPKRTVGPKAPAPRAAKLPNGTHVEVKEVGHPHAKEKGTIESAAPVAGTPGESMYTIRREDGSTFKAMDSAIKKA